METVWSSKGYRIPRTKESLQIVRKELTVFSEAPQEVPGPKPRVVCYRNDDKYIYVPLCYGTEKWGKPTKRFKQIAETIDTTFTGQLRDYQLKIMDSTLAQFETGKKTGIWALGTGVGKTILALYLVHHLKIKTLIIVHKQILLDQWIDRIREFLPNLKIGVIQGPKAEIEDVDIVIGMVQTMTQRTYDPNLFKSFGFLILDEVHNMCSRTFNEIFFKIQTKYSLGLSATPKRKDGFDKVLEFHLGKVLYEMHITVVQPIISIYQLEANEQVEMSLTRFGKTNLPALVTDLGGNDTRNAIITKILLNKVKEGRKILVLSDRVHQCELLRDFFRRNCTSGNTADTFVGKKTRDQLNVAMDADVILATYGIFKEGVDCPLLDTLILATPKTDIVQALGRILRQKNPNEPEVIDIVDNIGPLKNQYYKRHRYYKGKGYQISQYDQEGKLKERETIEAVGNFKPVGKCMIK